MYTLAFSQSEKYGSTRERCRLSVQHEVVGKMGGLEERSLQLAVCSVGKESVNVCGDFSIVDETLLAYISFNASPWDPPKRNRVQFCGLKLQPWSALIGG